MIYVGALGHIFGPNKERGVFLSLDGGKTWDKALYIDDRHGVADRIELRAGDLLATSSVSASRQRWLCKRSAYSTIRLP